MWEIIGATLTVAVSLYVAESLGLLARFIGG